MYCPNCGNQLSANNTCGRCGWREGAPITNVGPFPSGPRGPVGMHPGGRAKDISDDAGMRMLLPVGRSVWAIIAGYLGLVSILGFPAPLALITGIIAVLDIKKNPHKHGMGRAIFGIAMGLLFTIILIAGIAATLMSG